MASQGVIESYVGELGARLSGPAAVKRDLLAEAEHSLRDAAESFQDAGVPAGPAEQRAVAEFGQVEPIAREYQAELAAAQGMYAIRSLLLGLVAMHAVWQTVELLWIGSWEGWPPVANWALVVFSVMNWAWVVIAASAVVMLVLSRWLIRRWSSSQQLGRLAGTFMCVALGSYVLLQLAMLCAGLHSNAFVSVPILLNAMLGTLVMARLGYLTRRCFVLSAA